MGRFNGFSRKTIAYLTNLRRNNNKQWFDSHRDDYRRHLLEPFQNLALDLYEFMPVIDPDFELPLQITKTISRIYRDMRFSRDKSPYKTVMWLTLKRPGREWMDSPVYFFELGISQYRYGMGYYRASRSAMDRFRAKIDEHRDEFLKLVSLFEKQDIFSAGGEEYKRLINPAIPAALMNWYQKKNLYFICARKIDSRLFSAQLVDDLAAGFTLLKPFYYFLKD